MARCRWRRLASRWSSPPAMFWPARSASPARRQDVGSLLHRVPSYWNVVTLYLVALPVSRPVRRNHLARPGGASSSCRCAMSTRPARRYLRWLTIRLGLIWGGLTLLISDACLTRLVSSSSRALVFPLYYLVLSLRARSRRRAGQRLSRMRPRLDPRRWRSVRLDRRRPVRDGGRDQLGRGLVGGEVRRADRKLPQPASATPCSTRRRQALVPHGRAAPGRAARATSRPRCGTRSSPSRIIASTSTRGRSIGSPGRRAQRPRPRLSRAAARSRSSWRARSFCRIAHELRAQGQGSRAGADARGAAHQGSDSRAVSESRLPRRRVYGVEPMSRRLFGKPAESLTLAEARSSPA